MCNSLYKASRKLSEEEKAVNREIAKMRFVMERFFGTMKRKYHAYRVIYMALIKVHAQFIMKGRLHHQLVPLGELSKYKAGVVAPSFISEEDYSLVSTA
ncbi:MAG: transposase family protein [Gammaproteobacteria bacterium]|nr:transposase family protein [Gammaproteobacteria bacterium]